MSEPWTAEDVAEAWAFDERYPDNERPGARQEFLTWLATYERGVRAEAWDEGFDEGERDVMENHATFDEPCIPNPYREWGERG
jgi:uncharacterized protein YecA (UPF0149 family)